MQNSIYGGIVVKKWIKQVLLAIALMIFATPSFVHALDYWVEIEAPSSALHEDEGGLMVFRVNLVDSAGNSRTVDTDEEVSVGLSLSGDATLGSDFTIENPPFSPLVFVTGESTKDINVRVTPDFDFEIIQYETVIFSLESGLCTGATCGAVSLGAPGTGQIRDDENIARLTSTSTLHFAEDHQAGDWVQDYTVSLERAIPAGAPDNFNIAWNTTGTATATDYTPAVGNLIFSQGAPSSQDIQITIINDNVMEPDPVEGFDLTISTSNPSLYIEPTANSIETVIYDNDNEISLRVFSVFV